MVTKEQMTQLRAMKRTSDNTRNIFLPTWKAIAQAVDPSELRGLDHAKPAEASLADYCKMYDTTAAESAALFADGLQAYAFGQTSDWFRVRPEEDRYYETDDQKAYFQKCERHMMKQLQESNFYHVLNAFLFRGCNFATAVMVRMEDIKKGRPMYLNLNLGQCSIGCNRYGEVDTLFRDFYLPLAEAMQEYPNKLPARTTANWETKPDSLVKFSQYIGPTYKCALSIDGTGLYANVVWCEDEPDRALIEELLPDKPFFCWRYKDDPVGTGYGVKSPGWVYTPASRQLQSEAADELKIVQLTARPPIKRTAGLAVNFVPSGYTDLAPGQDFAPVQVTGDISGIEATIARAQQSIKSGYYVDFFLALLSHIEQTKTASEAYLLQDEKSAIMSTFFSKLSADFIEPMMEDLWASEIAAGRMPKAPESLADKPVRIDFVSPMASQQKRAHALNPTNQWLQNILGLSQVAQSVMDVVNWDAYTKLSAEYFDVDRTVINSDETVMETRAARAQAEAQAAQQQAQIQGMGAMADAYDKLGKAPEKGSLVDMSREKRQQQ